MTASRCGLITGASYACSPEPPQPGVVDDQRASQAVDPQDRSEMQHALLAAVAEETSRQFRTCTWMSRERLSCGVRPRMGGEHAV